MIGLTMGPIDEYLLLEYINDDMNIKIDHYTDEPMNNCSMDYLEHHTSVKYTLNF